MHDPDAVAFQIRRPWPRRSRDRHVGPRWHIGWDPTWTLAGRSWRFPPLVTVWHHEPGGRDCSEVCKHYRRWQDGDGEWQTTMLRGWRFHVWHWHLQVHPLQQFRRWALTRCAWCGDRSTKTAPVNVSRGWDTPRGRWWRGEPDLYHHDCSIMVTAHRKCLCDDPGLDHGDYGKCVFCGKHRAYGSTPDEADRILAALPVGSRLTPEVRAAVEPAWAERRRRRESEPEEQ